MNHNGGRANDGACDSRKLHRRMALGVGAFAGLTAVGALAISFVKGPPGLSLVWGFAIGAASLAVAGSFWVVNQKRLAVPDMSRPGFREVAERGYQHFLTWGPLCMGIFAGAASLSLAALRDDPDPLRAAAHSVSVGGFLFFWVLFSFLMFGRARRRPFVEATEDELVHEHRARSVAAGYVTASAAALAFMVLTMFWPARAYVASPFLLALPLIVAMSRFARLQRKALDGKDD